MDRDELFKQYQRYISDLMSLASAEDILQKNIAKEERNKVAEVENEFLKLTAELQGAKKTATNQYQSVWESCTTSAGLRRPEAQRPSCTDKNWRECVKIQEDAAKEIQEWFARKTQRAIAERQRQLQQEVERKAASAALAAKADQKRKEETATLEETRGASLLAEMKRKFRRNI